MTLIDVLGAAGGPYALADHKPIRRACWTAGFCIWWSPSFLCWMSKYGNDDPEPLFRTPTQGCLTPETIAACDWEVAS